MSPPLQALESVSAILLIPSLSAVLLAVLPGYWIAARLNVAASLITFLFALQLLGQRPAPGGYRFVDDLNIVFVVLATFVGFTTSAFSASYIAHELESGRLTRRYLRFYHAMYQTLMFAMKPGAGRQQYRPDVGCHRIGDANDRGDGRHPSHA